MAFPRPQLTYLFRQLRDSKSSQIGLGYGFSSASIETRIFNSYRQSTPLNNAARAANPDIEPDFSVALIVGHLVLEICLN